MGCRLTYTTRDSVSCSLLSNRFRHSAYAANRNPVSSSHIVSTTSLNDDGAAHRPNLSAEADSHV